MTHEPKIKPGSIQRNVKSGGIEFVMVCCGEFERTGHIQNLAAFADNEERKARIDMELQEHAELHARELAAEEFLKQYSEPDVTDCPTCNDQVAGSQS